MFCEHTLFTKSQIDKILIVSFYVDYLIYIGNDVKMCNDFKSSMMSKFDMYNLGRMRHFLGVEILHNGHGILTCQRKCAQDVLSHINVKNCNVVNNHIFPGTKLSRNDTRSKVDATVFK